MSKRGHLNSSFIWSKRKRTNLVMRVCRTLRLVELAAPPLLSKYDEPASA
jgi:hypothetical protein